MPASIPFIFRLGPGEPALSPESDLWSVPLPMSRHAFAEPSQVGDVSGSVRYGDYFTAAHDFLSNQHFEVLTDAAGRTLKRQITADDIQRIEISLLKHGAFYHPAHVAVTVGDRCRALVLNVAVSEPGRKTMPGEHRSLVRLNRKANAFFWPRVFGLGRGRTSTGGLLPMFLGEWLTGYYEFHLPRWSPSGRAVVEIWDTERGPYPLSGAPVLELLRHAARILSYAYNPLTFEAILDWHHAAGDFVVRVARDAVDVRLITVRNYAPLIRNPEPDIADILDGLLTFLVAASLRLRLDRQEGIGAPAVYPGEVVPAICEGFWQGLHMAAESRELPADLIPAARTYFGVHEPTHLAPLAEAVLAHYPQGSEDAAAIKAMAGEHLTLLTRAMVRD